MSQPFSDFKTAVRDLITVDGARHGVSLGSAKYFDRMVTAALLDMQSFIPQLKEGHRNVFKEFDVTEEGEASIGEIPDRAIITDSYYVTKTCHCIRRPFVPYPWENRFDLFCGKPRIVGWQYFIATSPFADKFVIFPKLKTLSECWLYWSGIKGVFDDDDEVKFSDEEAEAVSYFVKSRITREVDKDLVLSGSYWTSYAGNPSMMGIRTRLTLDWKRRAEAPPATSSPQPERMGHCDCKTTICCFDGASCGFSGGFFYLLDTGGAYHKITVVGTLGEEEFLIGPPIDQPTWDDCVTASAEGYGFFGGWFHLINQTTEEFVAISIIGSGSEKVFEFEPQKGEIGNISTTAFGYRFDPCLKVRNKTTDEFCPLDLLVAGTAVIPGCVDQAAVLDLRNSSSNGTTILDWNLITGRDTTEVWRSINDGEWTKIADVDGDVSTYTDTDVMSAMDVYCYKVRGVTDDVESDFSNEVCAVNEMIFEDIGEVSKPTWVIAYGDFGAANSDQVTSLSLPAMKVFGGGVFLDSMLTVTSINLDAMESVEGDFLVSTSAMAVISLPSCKSIGGKIGASNCPNLTTFSAPVFTTLGGDIELDDCVLTSVVITVLMLLNGKTYAFDTNALPPAVTEHILTRTVASGVTSASVFLNGGTNALLSALSAEGQANVASLISDGNTISIDP
jgi:hypothetical protein